MPADKNRFVQSALRHAAAGAPSTSAVQGIEVTGLVVYADGRAVSVEVFGRVLPFEADGEHLRAGEAELKLHRVQGKEFLVES